MKVTLKKLNEMIENDQVSVAVGEDIPWIPVGHYDVAGNRAYTPQGPYAIGGRVKLVDEDGTILAVKR